MNTKTEMKHTPTPWEVGLTGDNRRRIYSFSQKCNVAQMNTPFADKEIEEANAAFIVRAVNAHESLVKRLKTFVETMETLGFPDDFQSEIQGAREDLAKAEGRA